MKINTAQFIRGVVDKASLPNDYPEIAVVGRSNVGKSSLLNYLLNRKKLVSFSKTPGKTKQLNYFLINEKFYFVDIPGFGYAKLSKKEHEGMLKLIETYFTHSKRLAGILFLFDIRIPNSPVDADSLDWLLQYDHPILFLTTKADKKKKGQINQLLAEFQKQYHLPDLPIPTSSLKKFGKKEVWTQINGLLGFN